MFAVGVFLAIGASGKKLLDVVTDGGPPDVLCPEGLEHRGFAEMSQRMCAFKMALDGGSGVGNVFVMEDVKVVVWQNGNSGGSGHGRQLAGRGSSGSEWGGSGGRRRRGSRNGSGSGSDGCRRGSGWLLGGQRGTAEGVGDDVLGAGLVVYCKIESEQDEEPSGEH